MNKLVCVFLALALGVSGCGSLKRAAPLEGNKTVAQIDQAASLHTSITSIAPWDEVKDKLKPGFTMSANDALAKSIPTTLVRLDRVLDILRFQLAATPSIERKTSTATTSAGTGKDPTASLDTKTERSSPELTEFAPPSGLIPATPLVPVSNAPDTPADALLQYQTAANLLRDIAVLNAEIDNVSRRTGQDAFLTRIQVSVMPLRHGLGYDVYANLSLFGSTGSFDAVSGERTVGDMLPVVPLVIPILSTDSIQATRRSTNSTTEREVGLALNLLKGFGGLGASYGRGQQNQSDAAGEDLESVVTVGRLSDNTIRIRMGADPLPGGGYGMVPRTFNISAVVFVPKRATQLYYVSRVSMHHVIDGSELSAQRTPTYEEGIATIARNNHRDFNRLTPDLLMSPLDDHAYHGNFKSFAEELAKVATPGTTPLELQRQKMYVWSQLIALNRQTRFANSVIDIPRPPPMVWPIQNQLVAYAANDNGISVSMGLGRHLRRDAIDARLLLGTCANVAPATRRAVVPARSTVADRLDHRSATLPCKPTAWTTFVQATSVAPSPDGRSVILQFPAVKLATLLGSASAYVPYGVTLAGYEGSRVAAPEQTYLFAGELAAKANAGAKPAAPTASLVPESGVITADENRRGSIAFVVQGGDKSDLKVQVHSSVRAIADESGKAVVRKGVYWEVVDGGRYLLDLENLSERASVSIDLVSASDTAKKPTMLSSTRVRVEQAQKK